MPRYHATSKGNIPFTAEEEAQWNAEVAEWEAGANDRSAAEARAKRDRLLNQSDWTQMPDYSGANKADWATYRQALRDVPAQSDFPTTINWPVEP